MLVLLDLNFTLAVVDHQDKRSLTVRIPQETYRAWIPALCQEYDATVAITTARPEKYAKATLERILDQLDWEPDSVFFAQTSQGMPHQKKHDNLRRIVNAYGQPNNENTGVWFGLESNPRTRDMYAEYGIDSTPVPKFGKWQDFPAIQQIHPTRTFPAGGVDPFDLPFGLPS